MLAGIITVSANGPSASIRYYNSGNDVIAAVYFNDSGGFECQVASDVASNGGSLDWSGNLTPKYGLEQPKYVTYTMTKYKNYYFRIYSGFNETIVRAFPVDFNRDSGPRYQNSYAHGNFASDTSMCAHCHSTHSSLKAQLLKQVTYYELCMVCHSNSLTGSKYDVEKGKVYMGSATGWVDSLAGPIGTAISGVTSKHNIDDTVNTTVYVLGSSTDPGTTLTFTCISCHEAHGGQNDNYRLLKKTIYPADGKWNPQSVNFTAYAVVKEDFSLGELSYFVSGNTEFCAACHLDYDEGNARVTGGVYSTYTRHPVTVAAVAYSVYATAPAKDYYPVVGDDFPLQYYSAGESKTADKRTAVVCETCHYAHGTYKSFNAYLPTSGATFSNQKMLRLDNYGVCQSCHKK